MANKKERFWFIDNSTLRARMGIVEKATNVTTKDGYVSEYTAVSEAKDITIYAIARDNDLAVNSLTSTWTQIPAQFHEVMVSKVIAMGYKDPRHMELQTAQYFEQEYEKGIKKAKKFSRSNYQTTGVIRPQDF
jgi:restriction endonuclease Mrr